MVGARLAAWSPPITSGGPGGRNGPATDGHQSGPTEDPKQRFVVEYDGGSRSVPAIPSCRPTSRCAARATRQLRRLGPTTTAQSARTCKSIVPRSEEHTSELQSL